MIHLNRSILTLTIALLSVAWLVPSAQAVKLYKWVDQNGNVTYHDRPPPTEGGYRVESKTFKLRSGEPRGPTSNDASVAAEKYPVIIYSTPQCTSCDLARAYLGKRNVPFTDKNVQGNRELLKELQDKTGSLTVPTIMIGEKVMKGYLESLLAGELDAAGYPKIETAQSTEGQDETARTTEGQEQ
ncbi:MAG: glutaredoxin domain-containing protein [Acidiferrobacterales bacterium]